MKSEARTHMHNEVSGEGCSVQGGVFQNTKNSINMRAASIQTQRDRLSWRSRHEMRKGGYCPVNDKDYHRESGIGSHGEDSSSSLACSRSEGSKGSNTEDWGFERGWEAPLME